MRQKILSHQNKDAFLYIDTDLGRLFFKRDGGRLYHSSPDARSFDEVIEDVSKFGCMAFLPNGDLIRSSAIMLESPNHRIIDRLRSVRHQHLPETTKK